jgi:hypothetical protein
MMKNLNRSKGRKPMQADTENILENIIPIAKAPEKLSIAEKTLRNWRSQGLYPQIFVKIGGKVFIDLGEFANIIVSQKEKSNVKARRLGLID